MVNTYPYLVASNGVRMKSRILPENVCVELGQKTFASPLYKQIANFEFAKLGRFGPTKMTLYDRA